MARIFKDYGPGVGLRHKHVTTLLEERPTSISWLEAVTENYLKWDNGFQVKGIQSLLKLREHYPIALHGVSMNIESADSLRVRNKMTS
jgi:uncharacterized protein (UPF0276 family)